MEVYAKVYSLLSLISSSDEFNRSLEGFTVV